jgi:predicted protein tyrosine phosphatase
MIYVCPLSCLQQSVNDVRARHVVTLVRDESRVFRPHGIEPDNHLWLRMDDIVEPIDGYIAPAHEHVEDLLEFVQRWDRRQPLVVHCFAGISRSTAAAFITACALSPERDEIEIANRLRAASPTATPNPRLVALGDELLGRDGRMQTAIAHIGYGDFAEEARPFRLSID